MVRVNSIVELAFVLVLIAVNRWCKSELPISTATEIYNKT